MDLKPLSFRCKLILSLTALLVPLVAGEAYFHYQHYTENRSMALTMQRDVALDLARATDTFVDRTVAVQRAAGQALAMSHWHSAQVRTKYIESVLDTTPPLLQIAFANLSGKIVEGAPPHLVGLDISDRDYFRSIRSGADWAVSDLVANRICGKCGFVIATAVRDLHGNLLGVVVSGVDEKKLLSVMHIQPPRHGVVVLVDTAGRLTFVSSRSDIPANERQWGSYGFVRAALRGRTGYADRLSQRGQPVMTGAMVPIGSLGWASGAFVPVEQVAGPVRDMAMRDLGITLAVLGITFLIGSVVAKQMTAPVEHLSQAAERLGRGEFDTRAPVSNTLELASLARTMNQMAESIQGLYERERRIATILQQRMLPEVPARIGRTDLASGYFAALEEAELGGDFYDVMLLPNGLVGLLIADVSGKGLSAAVHTAMVKYTLEGFACEDPSPSSALSRVNRVMHACPSHEQDTFVTAFLGVLEPNSGRFVYANAGHPAPLWRHSSGCIERLDQSPCPPLGTIGTPDYQETEIALVAGDNLVMYTDGVIEARCSGQWFDMEGLEAVVGTSESAPGLLVSNVYEAVSQFVGGRLPDDIGLLVVRFDAAEEISAGGIDNQEHAA